MKINGRKYRGLVLFLRFDDEKSRSSLEEIYAFVGRTKTVEWHIVQIDNRDENRPWKEINLSREIREYVVGGDNSNGEFSGWDVGWEESCNHLGENFDLVLMTNDALKNSKPLQELLSIDDRVISYVSQRKSALGWVDTFARVNKEPMDLIGNPMIIQGKISRKWLSTCFVLLNGKLCAKITPFASELDLGRIYYDSFDGSLFRDSCGLNDAYKDFLKLHQTQTWGRKYTITPDTYPLFRYKTRMIINEHLLGVRIFEHASRVYSIRELARTTLKKERLLWRLQLVPFLRSLALSKLSDRLSEGEMQDSITRLEK